VNKADPVMQEVWRAKQANATKHRSLATCIAFLRKQAGRKHPGGRVSLAADAIAESAAPAIALPPRPGRLSGRGPKTARDIERRIAQGRD
jgi:hypothetical protein